MAKVICIANQKGASEKPPRPSNLSASLGSLRKIPFWWMRSPGQRHLRHGIDKNALTAPFYDGSSRADAGSLLRDSDIDSLKVIPSNVQLIGFEVEMMPEPGREMALKTLIALCSPFEYIILDCRHRSACSPSNALTAADSLLIPLQCEFYALEASDSCWQTVKRISALSPRSGIAGILLTMFDRRTNLSTK